jgi:hypothetical protein
MLATFMNTARVLSIGVFFTLMIVGLASGLPSTLDHGLVAHGVPAVDAARVSHLPPVATLFASFLGYNPMQTLLGPHVLGALPPGQAQELTGRSFFPQLISGPFHTALVYAFVFAIACCVVAAVSFALLIVLPVDFAYPWFALVLLLNGIGMGLFASPNSAGVMNSLPPTQRGAGAGMLATFMNTASVLSIGVFFTLMIVGLASGLPHTLQSGLVAHGVPAADAARISHLPPVATLFASFLGYNPMATLLGPHTLHALPAGQSTVLTGRRFFPHLIAPPFHTALVYAFVFAIVACLVAAVASMLRGGKYHHAEITTSELVAADEAA